jgi:tetratricopeptide (TPR) repeat protein
VSELAADTQLMLLRQLYMSHLEQERYADARAISEQMVELSATANVDPEGLTRELAHHDAARAASALGDFDAALGHLRLASRVAPARRRGFQLWSLGSTLYSLGSYAEAERVLERSARWAPKHKAIHQALHALALAAQSKPADLAAAYERLSELERQPAIVDWVGGELLIQLQRPSLALPLLRRFVLRNSLPVRLASLRAEVARAQRLVEAVEAALSEANAVTPPEARKILG